MDTFAPALEHGQLQEVLPGIFFVTGAMKTMLMGSHWHAWLEAHRAPGFLPEHHFRLIEVADTPESAAERVLTRLSVAAGEDRS